MADHDRAPAPGGAPRPDFVLGPADGAGGAGGDPSVSRDEVFLGVEPPPPVTGTGRLAALARNHQRALAVLLAALLVVAGTLAGAQRYRDAEQTVQTWQLINAIRTFRPTSNTNQNAVLSAEDLRRTGHGNTVPGSCAPLVTFTPSTAVDGVTWSEISGPSYDSLDVIAIRFADPDQARTVFRAMADGLASCRRGTISYPPYDTPSEDFTVAGRSPGPLESRDRLSYTVAYAQPYAIDARRYGNTIIWAYAATTTDPLVRRSAADDLVARLQTLLSRS